MLGTPTLFSANRSTTNRDGLPNRMSATGKSGSLSLHNHQPRAQQANLRMQRDPPVHPGQAVYLSSARETAGPHKLSRLARLESRAAQPCSERDNLCRPITCHAAGGSPCTAQVVTTRAGRLPAMRQAVHLTLLRQGQPAQAGHLPLGRRFA